SFDETKNASTSSCDTMSATAMTVCAPAAHATPRATLVSRLATSSLIPRVVLACRRDAGRCRAGRARALRLRALRRRRALDVVLAPDPRRARGAAEDRARDRRGLRCV